MSPSSRHSRRGMTMIEVMVAVTILVVMSVMIMSTLQSSIEFTELLDDRDVTTRQARVAMSKLRRDISLAYLTPAMAATETIQTVFVGMDDDPDQLIFATLAHQRIYRDSRECDQAEISIWAEDAPREKGDGSILYYRESPRVDEIPDEQGVVYPLAYNVRSFNLRYLDPVDNEWKDEWDTRGSDTPYRLPRAVEIGLVLMTPDGEHEGDYTDVPFMTTVGLTFADRIANKNNPRLNSGLGPFGGRGIAGTNVGASGWAGGTAGLNGRSGQATPGTNLSRTNNGRPKTAQQRNLPPRGTGVNFGGRK